MASDTLVFVLALLDDATLLALTVYFFITLSDLECDYLNATSCCDKLNKWIYPEIVAHSLLSLSLILSGHWILFCLYSSMTAWVIYKFVSKPSGNIGLYDPAEIHNRQQLKVYMKECLIKLVFHLVFFFVFLYNSTALDDRPANHSLPSTSSVWPVPSSLYIRLMLTTGCNRTEKKKRTVLTKLPERKVHQNNYHERIYRKGTRKLCYDNEKMTEAEMQ